jgi:benzoyl-CoA reductase subunit D
MTNPTSELLTSGVDVGSASIKVAILRDRGPAGAEVLAGRSERIRRRETAAVVEQTFADALAEAGLVREELDYIATTGEGENVPFRTGHFYGMTTHARGAVFLEPTARACLDVGALHARAILMDERAKVLGYRMTSQCASGSGQFLENISRYLGVTMAEIGSLSMRADAPETCSSICAVLAETDVINMVSRGISTANILKGIHLSMAGRFLKLLSSAGADSIALVTGGLAADVGLIAALSELAEESGANLDLRVHPQSALAGALGAALWGAFRARKLADLGVSLELEERVPA